MNIILKKASMISIALLFAFSFDAAAAEISFSFYEDEQECDKWCWNASAKMVLDYLLDGYSGTPTQTAIANWAIPGTPKCVVNYMNYSSGGQYGVKQIINHYSHSVISASYIGSDLSFSSVWYEVSAYEPIVVRWDWVSGSSYDGHIVVITGANNSTNEIRFTDPFWGDSYWCSYSWFKYGQHFSNYPPYTNDPEITDNVHEWDQSVKTDCYWAYCPYAWEQW